LGGSRPDPPPKKKSGEWQPWEADESGGFVQICGRSILQTEMNP